MLGVFDGAVFDEKVFDVVSAQQSGGKYGAQTYELGKYEWEQQQLIARQAEVEKEISEAEARREAQDEKLREQKRLDIAESRAFRKEVNKIEADLLRLQQERLLIEIILQMQLQEEEDALALLLMIV